MKKAAACSRHWISFFLAVLLIFPAVSGTEAEGTSAVPPEAEGEFVLPEQEEGFAPSGSGESDPDGFLESDGQSGGLPGQLGENFDADDLPDGYLDKCDQQGYVEKLRYKSSKGVNKICMVYVPYGYDATDEKYNVLYLIHASSGDPENYLSPKRETSFKNLLDNMIADGVIRPMIVVAPTYYATEGDDSAKSSPLQVQVEATENFQHEIVEDVIPLVEPQYRTWLESEDEEGIVFSRNHRGIAGFSLGGVAAWNAFRTEMKAFRWFVPISEASWADDEGGTSGIWDSDMSAEVLYNAILDQGYGPDDFRLFVATGSEDEAFDIATSQMVSLLDNYPDMFLTGENTSCSMMSNGKHKLSAVYTYMYHILPALFREEPAPESE